MKTFIYKVENKRPQTTGGVKQDIVVYRMKNNKPHFVGKTEVNTASYKGDEGTDGVIDKIKNFKLKPLN